MTDMVQAVPAAQSGVDPAAVKPGATNAAAVKATSWNSKP
jgi:hypothetical protein